MFRCRRLFAGCLDFPEEMWATVDGKNAALIFFFFFLSKLIIMQQAGHTVNFLCWAFGVSRLTVGYDCANLLDSIMFAHLDSVILLLWSLLDRCLLYTQIWTLTLTLQNSLYLNCLCYFLHMLQAIIDYIKQQCLLQLLLTKYSGIFCCGKSSRVTPPSLSCEVVINEQHRELLLNCIHSIRSFN